jgi:hypothetical protein
MSGQSPSRLGDVAALVRSKNAGPFLITFDILFGELAPYERAKDLPLIDEATIADLYAVPEEDVRIVFYDPALAIKVTIPRHTTSGDPLDPDIYGAQQHAPLIDLPFSVSEEDDPS